MIFAHGTLLPEGELPALLDGLGAELNATRSALALEAETVIAAVDTLGRQLARGELDGLIAQYAPPGAREALDQVRPLLTRQVLEQKLAIELGPDFSTLQSRPFGAARTVPLGVLFHVAAGNQPGLPAFSALEGLLTGNINLIKLPRADRGLTFAILAKLVETEPRLAPFLYAFDLPSGDTANLERLAALADGLVVWGGEGAVAACRRLAPVGCKLMEWGHRLSFAYLSHWEDTRADWPALAEHIIETEGLLCSSCQVVYLDTENMEQAEKFCAAFLPLLEEAARRRAPGKRAQASLYTYETLLEHIVDRAGADDRFFRGQGCSLTLRSDRELELSPLHGSVLVKCLPRQELLSTLRRQRGKLQTAGLLCPEEEREALTSLLARTGLTRITRAGHMSHSFPGEGHDGEYPLRRYLRVVDTED